MNKGLEIPRVYDVVREKVFLLGHSSGGLIAAYINLF